MLSHQYLRVTIRSKRAFKGFLIRASSGMKILNFGLMLIIFLFSDTERYLGVWYIPYLEDTSYLSESSYLHCGGRTQSAVTHSGRTNTMYVLSLQWKPPAGFYGKVSFQATVVENYRFFWLDVLSSPVYVILKESDQHDPDSYEVSRKEISPQIKKLS